MIFLKDHAKDAGNSMASAIEQLKGARSFARLVGQRPVYLWKEYESLGYLPSSVVSAHTVRSDATPIRRARTSCSPVETARGHSNRPSLLGWKAGLGKFAVYFDDRWFSHGELTNSVGRTG